MIPMREAERKTGKSWWAIRAAISAGKVRAVRIDGRIHVRESDVMRLLEPVPIRPQTETRRVASS
jgi:hypothetical protein